MFSRQAWFEVFLKLGLQFRVFFLSQILVVYLVGGVSLCGGINPYTLTAKLGPARIDGSGPPERRRAAQPT